MLSAYLATILVKIPMTWRILQPIATPDSADIRKISTAHETGDTETLADCIGKIAPYALDNLVNAIQYDLRCREDWAEDSLARIRATGNRREAFFAAVKDYRNARDMYAAFYNRIQGAI